MRTECKLFKAIMKKNQSETIPVTNVVIYASRTKETIRGEINFEQVSLVEHLKILHEI